MQNPKHIVITGASSGIGAALALAYAAPGITLGLLARRADKLEELAGACRTKGASVWHAPVDVTQRESLAAILEKEDSILAIDLLFANAGISAGTFGKGESETQARAVFSTNLDGVLNTVFPVLPRMLQRRGGQIALMASLAGFRGFPSAPAYCASKAAVRVYGEGLRAECARHNVEISVICPGYVDTPMTRVNGFPMPFLINVEKSTRFIVKGLARNDGRIAFPWPMALAVWILAALPPSWTDPLLSRLPKKAPLDTQKD
jgi:short-subunit dehydrogenase